MNAYTVSADTAEPPFTSAANKILAGKADVILAGGTESMSQIPLLFNDDMKEIFVVLLLGVLIIFILDIFIRIGK